MIDFLQKFDEYCERTDFQFLSEPLNFFSNLFFWVAAYLAWREIRASRQTGSSTLKGLVFLLFMVGLGSGCYHSFATRWAMFCDVGFIGLFVLWFLWCWMREVLRMNFAKTLLVFIGFFVLSGILQAIFKNLPVNGSQGYFGVAVFLLVFGWQQAQRLSRRKTLLMAGLTFVVALVFRTLDASICSAWPYGTHFLWHSLNACVCYLTIRGMRQELATGS